MIATLVAGALVVPATLAAPAGAAGGGGGGALATVPNGLTTTDLSAVGMSPTTLAQTLVGSGVSVSNVTYSGANAQAGTIHVVDPAVVSFNDGIILSSGNIADVVGPNKSDSTTGDMAGPADADLTALIAGSATVNPMTYDAASLEFDFVPTASQVYFTYTFSSDEYLEWVNLFNDVFAFYVNGQNCATVPGGAPVSIDTINDAVNPNLFRDNSFSSPPANPINFESDGLSVEMICSAPVNAGQTNHMKLAIADTSDQILDTNVMIKAQSLSTIKPESCNDHVDNDDDALVDEADDSCTATTTPPPTGSGGIGSSGKKPAFTGYEGTPILLDGEALNWHASNDTITTTWTVDGINGTTGSCEIVPSTPQAVLPDRVIAPVSAICPNEGEYVARVEGWDVEGGSAFDKDVDFFVQNAPPAVTIDAPVLGDTALVGEPVQLSATVIDPGAADTVGCEISWGDGTSEPGDLADGTCTGSHAYDDATDHIVSVTATDDAADTGAAATLLSVAPASFHVAGTVTDASSGAGLGDIRVQALRSDNSVVATATTAADGSYDLVDLDPALTYRVRATDLAVPAAHLTLVSSATAVPATGFDLALVPTAAISGTVTSAANGAPIAGIRVQALKADNSIVATTSTGPTGTFDLGGLAAGGTYRLRYADVSASPTYFGLTAPTAIPAGTTGVAQALAPIGHIDGTVTSATTGAPISGIRVQALKADNSIVGTTYTGADGRFDLGSLSMGSSYRIRYTDLTLPPPYAQYVTSSPIPAGTGGITQSLQVHGHITGRVLRAAGGAPMAGVRVQAVTPDNSVVQAVVTGADGTFDLDRVIVGTTYAIRYSDTQAPARFAVSKVAGVATGTAGITKLL